MVPSFKDRIGNVFYINPSHVVKLQPFEAEPHFGECTVIYHDTTYQDSDGESEMFTTEVAEPAAEVWKKLFGKKPL